MVYREQIATKSLSKKNFFFKNIDVLIPWGEFEVLESARPPQFSVTREPQQVEKQDWCQTIVSYMTLIHLLALSASENEWFRQKWFYTNCTIFKRESISFFLNNSFSDAFRANKCIEVRNTRSFESFDINIVSLPAVVFYCSYEKLGGRSLPQNFKSSQGMKTSIVLKKNFSIAICPHKSYSRMHFQKKLTSHIPVSITARDQMFLRMQNFDFAQI